MTPVLLRREHAKAENTSDPDVLHALAQTAESSTRLRVAGNCHMSDQTILLLATDFDPLVRAELVRAVLPPLAQELLARDLEPIRFALADQPLTEPAQALLALDSSPRVVERLARASLLARPTQALLAHSPSALVRTILATRHGLDPEVEATLAKDASASVCRGIAGRAHLAVFLQEILSFHADETVLRELAFNPFLTFSLGLKSSFCTRFAPHLVQEALAGYPTEWHSLAIGWEGTLGELQEALEHLLPVSV